MKIEKMKIFFLNRSNNKRFINCLKNLKKIIDNKYLFIFFKIHFFFHKI